MDDTDSPLKWSSMKARPPLISTYHLMTGRLEKAYSSCEGIRWRFVGAENKDRVHSIRRGPNTFFISNLNVPRLAHSPSRCERGAQQFTLVLTRPARIDWRPTWRAGRCF